MSLTEIFNWMPKKSAKVAKERLQILVAHQRALDSKPLDSLLLEQLRRELLLVLGRYLKIDSDQVQVQLQNQGDVSVLELNVTLLK
ncbi:MAG: cell division topological specificity factor MinE [Gammaproteobacteria bacterium]